MILLVDGDVQVVHPFFGFLEKVDSRCAGSHEDYPQFPSGAKGFLTDAVAGSIDLRNVQAISFLYVSIRVGDMAAGCSRAAVGAVLFHHHCAGWNRSIVLAVLWLGLRRQECSNSIVMVIACVL